MTIRSILAAFITVCLCFAILQIPSRPESVPLPTSAAAPPRFELLPMPTTGGCPGGVCPVPARVVQSVPAVATVSQSATHWTYPGEIKSHLSSGHGVDASGMSTAQAEALHDSLHNGGTSNPHRTVTRVATYAAAAPVTYVRRTPIRTVARGVASIRPVQRVANLVRGVGRVVLLRRCR